MKVSTINLRTLALLISLNILTTLNALSIVVLLPAELFEAGEISIIIPIIEIITTAKSKMFQLSLKYALPYDIILITASKVNIAANM